MILKNLLKSKNHYGCLLKNTSTQNFPYLYGIRFKRCIINLEYTVISLKRCLLLLKKFLINDKNILIVCNDFRNRYLKKHLKHKNIINTKWQEGLLTKNDKINIDLIVLFNSENNDILIKEACLKKIPIISFIDTNIKSYNITFPIFTNESNFKSLFLLIYFFRKIL